MKIRSNKAKDFNLQAKGAPASEKSRGEIKKAWRAREVEERGQVRLAGGEWGKRAKKLVNFQRIFAWRRTGDVRSSGVGVAAGGKGVTAAAFSRDDALLAATRGRRPEGGGVKRKVKGKGRGVAGFQAPRRRLTKGKAPGA